MEKTKQLKQKIKKTTSSSQKLYRSKHSPEKTTSLHSYRPLRTLMSSNQPNFADSFERQADCVASAWSSVNRQPFSEGAGEKPLLSGLLSAPAAQYDLANSAAEVLPSQLKATMETSLNADLSAVRIHRDSAAYKAAESVNARAFVAGSHVYFGEGMFQPNSIAGKELLVHEITHVLQQTGRKRIDGRIEARSIRGQGEIQRKDFGDLFFTDAEVNALDFDSIVKAHNPTNAKTKAFVKKFRGLLNASSNKDVVYNNFDFWIDPKNKDTIFNEPIETLSLAYDLCKFKKKHLQALKILNWKRNNTPLYRHSKFKSALPTQSFYQYWLSLVTAEQIGAVIYEFWTLHDFYKMLGPRTFIQSLRVYFMGLTRQKKQSSFGVFGKESQKLLKRLKFAKTSLSTSMVTTDKMPGELFFMALKSVRTLNKLRKWVIKRAFEKTDTALPLYVRRLNALSKFGKRFKQGYDKLKDGSHKRSTDEVTAFLNFSYQSHTIGDRVIIASNNAAKFWDSISKILRQLSKGHVPKEKFSLPFDAFKSVDAAKVLDAGRNLQAVKILEKKWIQLFGENKLLGRGAAGKILEPDLYQKQVDQNIKKFSKLNKENKHFQRHLINMFFHEVKLRSPKKRKNEAAAMGIIILLVEFFVQMLKEYKKAKAADELNIVQYEAAEIEIQKNPAFKNNRSTGRDDVRIAHRLDITHFLSRISHFFGIDSVTKQSGQVLQASENKQTDNEIALLSDWEKNSDATITDFGNDFSHSRQVEGWQPLSVGDAYHFFRFIYYRKFESALRHLITSERKGKSNLQDSKRELIYNRALVQANKVPRPTKYEVKDSRLLFKTTPGAKRSRAGDLILRHYKTRQLLKSLNKKNQKVIVPLGAEKVFLWIIPPVPELISKLKGVLVLPKQSKVDPKANWYEWWQAVSQEFTRFEKSGKTPKTTAQSVEKFNQIVESESDSARGKFVEAARATSIHERAIANVRVSNLLSAFDPSGRALDKKMPKGFAEVFNSSIPDMVLQEMDKFVFRVVYPFDEWPFHLVAMLLENATLLEKKLNPDRGWMKKGTKVGLVRNFIQRIDFAVELSNLSSKIPASVKDKKLFRSNQVKLRRILKPRWRKDKSNKALERQRKKLIKLRQGLNKVIKDIQSEQGLQGSKQLKGSGTDAQLGYLSSIGAGASQKVIAGENKTEMTIDGITWRIKEVKHDFVYHPPVKMKSLGSKASASTKSGDSFLKVDGKVIDKLKDRKKITLLRVNINNSDTDFTVKASDDEMLEKIMHSVQMWGIIKSLQNTAEIIKTSFTFALEAAEFIPGPGWIAMATRLFAGIMSFLQSADFNQIVDAVQGLPKAIPDLENKLKSINSSDIAMFMLFADTSRLKALTGEKSKKSKATKKLKKGKLRRFFRAIANLGKLILAVFGKVQSKIKRILERVQLFFMGHPVVRAALGWVIDHAEEIKGKAPNLNWPDKSKIEDGGKKLKNKIPEALDNFNTIKAPKELVPMEQIVTIIIDMAIKVLGKKAELIAEGLLWGLRNAPGNLYKKLEKAIADKLRASANPNDLWVKAVRTHGEPVINNTYAKIRGEFNNFFSNLGVLTDVRLPEKKFQIGFTDNLDEIELFSNPNTVLPLNDHYDGGLKAKLGKGGSPLSQEIRSSMESSFGHDFSHVRVHTGAEGKATASAVNAQALTTGSHIYLAPGQNVSGGSDGHVFRHEMGHVLQQTGPRPVGGQYSSRPVTGKAGRGVVIDSRREAQADLMARQSGFGNKTHVDEEDFGKSEGIAPSGLLSRLLNRLLGFDDLKEEQEKIDAKSKAGTIPKALGAHVGRKAAAIKNDIYHYINGAKFKPSSPFSNAAEAIKIHLNNSKKTTALENAVARIALNAQKTETKTNSKSGSKKVEKSLDHKVFRNLLQRYMFAQFGLLLKIDLKKQGSKRKEDSFIKVTKVDVQLIHLPAIHGGTKLWSMALGEKPKSEHGKLIPRVRAFLTSIGPGSTAIVGIKPKNIWNKKPFRLQKWVFDETEKFMLAGGKKLLDPAKLWPKKSYLDFFNKSNGEGLRLGTYVGANQKGVERESHHIVQYLLIEFFANKSGKNLAFPLVPKTATSNLYPGLLVASKKPTKFTPGKQSNKAINIKEIEKNRSGIMPAVLLARPTHRRGNLHINKGDDFSNAIADAPGDGVKHIFRGKLKSDYTNAEDKGVTKFKTFTKDTGKDVVEKRIHNAMIGTYQWMRGKMRPRLKTALKSIEMPYYNDLAVLGNKKDRLTRNDMEKTYNNATKHEKKVMEETLHWKK